MQMMFPQNGSYFAMNSPEDDNVIMVMDMPNDQVVMFNRKEQTVFGMKSVMTLAKSMAIQNAESFDYTINKSGK